MGVQSVMNCCYTVGIKRKGNSYRKVYGASAKFWDTIHQLMLTRFSRHAIRAGLRGWGAKGAIAPWLPARRCPR